MVSTRCEFPSRVDLEPFVKENLAWRERACRLQDVAGRRTLRDLVCGDREKSTTPTVVVHTAELDGQQAGRGLWG
ncbi:unnamed protein product [Ectocarpus sp. 12 AP-2014]